MASNRTFGPKKVLASGVMTGTDRLESQAINIGSMKDCAFQFIWTGTPVGAFSIEGSVDGETFSDLGIPIEAAAGAAGSRLVNLTGIAVKHVQAVYENESGSGTLDVHACAKGI